MAMGQCLDRRLICKRPFMIVAVTFCFEFFFFLFNAEAKAILSFPSFEVTSRVNCYVKSFRNLQLQIK